MEYCCTNNQRTGSWYFELQKGKFTDKYWLANSIWLSDDILDSMNLYQVFAEVVPEFDYYGITEIDKEQWEQVKLVADRSGGVGKDIITEIDSWASSVLPAESVITVLGI
jgi:hypothetical protein